MQKLEQKFATQIKKWLEAGNMKFSFIWEAKFVRGTNYCFRSDKSFPKELAILLRAKKGIVSKNSDIAGFGTLCDGYKVVGSGYFFIKFASDPPKVFYCLSAEMFQVIKFYEFKSLTKEMCEKMGTKYELGKIYK